MALKFNKLTRRNIRSLTIPGSQIIEHGIEFKRLKNGDGCFCVNIMVDGVRIHRTIGKESDNVRRKQAELFIEQARTDARHGRLNLPKGRKLALNFRKTADKYLCMLGEEGGKDLKAKKHRLNDHLIPFFGKNTFSKITNFDIERYKKYRVSTGAANGTINRELAVLSHIFHKSVEWNWLDHIPAKINRLKEDNVKITYLSIKEMNRLLQAAKDDYCTDLFLFINIALDTAMRRSEILSIRIENINIDERTIYIPNAKAGPRLQPMTSKLARFLGECIKSKNIESPWLFPSKLSRTGHIMNIEKPWKRVVIAAGLDPNVIVRHTLRHTAITHLVQAGVDLPTVKRISGHKTLAMVERYSHQSGKHIEESMNKLQNRYLSASDLSVPSSLNSGQSPSDKAHISNR